MMQILSLWVSSASSPGKLMRKPTKSLDTGERPGVTNPLGSKIGSPKIESIAISLKCLLDCKMMPKFVCKVFTYYIYIIIIHSYFFMVDMELTSASINQYGHVQAWPWHVNSLCSQAPCWKPCGLAPAATIGKYCLSRRKVARNKT